MARFIGFIAYKFERGSDGLTNFVTQAYPDVVLSDDVMDVVPVNVLGGQDVAGLPFLYSKITKHQSGMNQEVFVMNSVLDIKTQLNA